MKFFIKCFSSFSHWAFPPINGFSLLPDPWTYKKVSGKDIEIGTFGSDENVPNMVCIIRAHHVSYVGHLKLIQCYMSIISQ